MKHVYSSIDIGTNSIKIVVCELYKNKLHLLAASSVASRGIKKGLITDYDLASISVKEALNEINEMLGIRVKKVIATVPSYFAEFSVITGSVKVESEDNVVTGDDITRVLQNAIASKMSNDKELVTTMPIDFKLDDKEEIRDPKGLVGSVLSTRAIMVTTPKKNIYSVVSLLENLGVEVVDISINAIGDMYAFRNKDLDTKVGAIVNIGADITTVSIYNKGIAVKSSIIGMGGSSIDNDIAYMYKVDVKQANRIKEKFALAYKRAASVSDMLEVVTNYGETIKINQFEVTEVVTSRLEEIISLAKKEVSILTNKPIDYIIITGGVSNMSHFENVLEEVMGKKASVGNVRLIGIRNNKYSTSIGNIVYFINKLKLKGKNYTMISSDDAQNLQLPRRSSTSNESMLGKIFDYFFGE